MNEERTSIGFLARLFGTFAKVGVMTFGGGYAMLPILQREIVEDRHWATEEELMDYYAVGQCTPGIIAVNTATFIGQKKAGIAGGIMATLGVVFPSIVIILLIASVLTHFADAPVVSSCGKAPSRTEPGSVSLPLCSSFRSFWRYLPWCM